MADHARRPRSVCADRSGGMPKVFATCTGERAGHSVTSRDGDKPAVGPAHAIVGLGSPICATLRCCRALRASNRAAHLSMSTPTRSRTVRQRLRATGVGWGGASTHLRRYCWAYRRPGHFYIDVLTRSSSGSKIQKADRTVSRLDQRQPGTTKTPTRSFARTSGSRRSFKEDTATTRDNRHPP